MNRSNGEFEIDISELLNGLWKKKHIIILSGTLLAIAAVFLSKFVLPEKYESSTSLYVLNWESGDTITYNDLQTATQLATDYKELILSLPVARQVIEDLDLEIFEEDFLDLISVSIPEDTRLITITSEFTDPNTARDIADKIRETAISHINTVMNTSSVNIAEEANLPELPTSPNIKQNGVIGAVTGLALSAFVLLVIELMDDTVKTPEEVERFADIPVLACIPLDESLKKEEKKSKRLSLKKQRRYYENS